MIIQKSFVTNHARILIDNHVFARQAYDEIYDSIVQNSNGGGLFTVNSSEKNCNGVVPVKDGIYRRLEEHYGWYREKPLRYFEDARKGGPIDVYKEFGNTNDAFHVGLEFETGNVSSAHRSMNKLHMGILNGDLQMAFLIMPIKEFAYYLTDRVSNYEEIEPYFDLLEDVPFVFFGFDADCYDPNAVPLPKGRDGMSKRSKRKWRNHK